MKKKKPNRFLILCPHAGGRPDSPCAYHRKPGQRTWVEAHAKTDHARHCLVKDCVLCQANPTTMKRFCGHACDLGEECLYKNNPHPAAEVKAHEKLRHEGVMCSLHCALCKNEESNEENVLMKSSCIEHNEDDEDNGRAAVIGIRKKVVVVFFAIRVSSIYSFTTFISTFPRSELTW